MQMKLGFFSSFVLLGRMMGARKFETRSVRRHPRTDINVCSHAAMAVVYPFDLFSTLSTHLDLESTCQTHLQYSFLPS